VEQFEPLDVDEFELWLDKLVDHVQNQRLTTNVVELKAIELAVKVSKNSRNSFSCFITPIFLTFSGLCK
jgi:hypothetical protein